MIAKISAISITPALMRLDIVAHAGDQHDDGHIGERRDIDLILTDPHGLDDHEVESGGIGRGARAGHWSGPVRQSRRGVAMDRMKTPGSE